MRHRTNPAEVIRAELDARGESLNWLAQETGIDFWTLYPLVEMETNQIDLDVAVKIADALGLELPHLIYGTEVAV